jgi:short-subunit dehydrogenase
MRRNILITGASAGLGEEMARQFAAKGHNLALTARREDRLQALRTELTAAHPQVEVVVHKLDVNDHDQVFEVFRKADAELVPAWPWSPLARVMRFAPLPLLNRMI